MTPVQRGRSGRYEDSGESDEDSDGDSQERPLPSRPRQDDDYMSEVRTRLHFLFTAISLAPCIRSEIA